jgi:hypothetical protein
MKRAALLALLAVAACSPAKQPPQSPKSEGAAGLVDLPSAPKTKAEELLYEYTHAWPGHAGASGPYAPRDACAGLGGAKDFRLALAKAVASRDADALVKLADPRIRLDFGNGHGADLLRKRLDSPIYKLWDRLAALVPLGCASQAKDSLTIPWVFAQDFGSRDSTGIMIVAGQDVPLLASPSAGAAVSETLSWDAVELASGETSVGKGPFAKVVTFDGKPGYVARKALRALIDYRLMANKTDEGWRITGLIAGD